MVGKIIEVSAEQLRTSAIFTGASTNRSAGKVMPPIGERTGFDFEGWKARQAEIDAWADTVEPEPKL